MQIKQQLGKLEVEAITDRIVRASINDNNIELLPITLAHVEQLNRLPMHHRDPFDRMLIAQVQVEGMALVSADAAMEPYDVEVVW